MRMKCLRNCTYGCFAAVFHIFVFCVGVTVSVVPPFLDFLKILLLFGLRGVTTFKFCLRNIGTRRRALHFYNTADNIVKDIKYGGATSNRLDVYTPTSTIRANGTPVLVFVHGFGWQFCDRRLLSMMAHAFQKRGMLVVVPDYTRASEGKIDDMVDDISKVLTWTVDNCESFGGSKTSIFLVGHSSGAHVASLTMTLKGLAEVEDAAHDTDSSTQSPRRRRAYSRDSLSGASWSLRNIKAFVGISGIYDLREHHQYERSTGASPLSVVSDVNHGKIHFDRFSPAYLVKSFSSDGERVMKGFPRCFLVHGDRDGTVPCRSSKQFSVILEKASIPVQFIEVPNAHHTDLVSEIGQTRSARVIKTFENFL